MKNQAEFENGLKLVSDSGHNMPILQLLADYSGIQDDWEEEEELTFVSLGYDRAITAWQTQDGMYIDQLTKLACLGQTIDKGMLAFSTSTTELLII